jgi:hypothetical protein
MMMWSLKAQTLLVGKGKHVKDVKVEACSQYMDGKFLCFFEDRSVVHLICVFLLSLSYKGHLTFNCSAMKNDDQVESKYALDVVKRKLLDSINALERGRKLGTRILEFEEHHAKKPLSLNAVAEGPRLHLLWASFRQVEEEAGTVSVVSFYHGYFAEIFHISRNCHFTCLDDQSCWFRKCYWEQRRKSWFNILLSFFLFFFPV